MDMVRKPDGHEVQWARLREFYMGGRSGGAGRIPRMLKDDGPVSANSEHGEGIKIAPPIPVNEQAAKQFRQQLKTLRDQLKGNRAK